MCGRAAAAAWLGRAAAWRSRARRQCTFQTKSAFGRNRALSGRARRAKLWALSSGRCRRAAPPLRSSYVVLSPQKGGRSVEFQNTESLELESASSLRKPTRKPRSAAEGDASAHLRRRQTPRGHRAPRKPAAPSRTTRDTVRDAAAAENTTNKRYAVVPSPNVSRANCLASAFSFAMRAASSSSFACCSIRFFCRSSSLTRFASASNNSLGGTGRNFW